MCSFTKLSYVSPSHCQLRQNSKSPTHTHTHTHAHKQETEGRACMLGLLKSIFSFHLLLPPIIYLSCLSCHHHSSKLHSLIYSTVPEGLSIHVCSSVCIWGWKMAFCVCVVNVKEKCVLCVIKCVLLLYTWLASHYRLIIFLMPLCVFVCASLAQGL